MRVEMAAHVDGYIAQAAHTVVIGATKEAPAKGIIKNKYHEGDVANAIQTAYLSSQAALRLMKPGSKSYQITEVIDKISKDFKCMPMQGQTSSQILRNVLDGPNHIIQAPTAEQKRECPEFDFETGQGIFFVTA